MADPHHQGKVIALGSINADFQMRVERRPEISETLLASDFKRLSGGKSANVAFFSRKLGLDAMLLGRVGDDDLAEQVLAPLRESGVDLSGVRQIAGMDTGVAIIMVPPDGKKGIVMAPNANAQWSEGDAASTAQAISTAPPGSVLVVNCEIPTAVLVPAMHAARQRGFNVILDPSPASHVTDALLGLSDIVTPNPSEAEQLTGIECKDAGSAVDAAAQLNARGVAAACIKLPDGGCVLLEKDRIDQVVRITAVPVAVVDTTGAGDAFAGALAVAAIEQQPWREAARLAVAASHIAVTRYGSQPSYPVREELEDMKSRLNVCLGVEPDG